MTLGKSLEHLRVLVLSCEGYESVAWTGLGWQYRERSLAHSHSWTQSIMGLPVST